jgi:hypothetical protein
MAAGAVTEAGVEAIWEAVVSTVEAVVVSMAVEAAGMAVMAAGMVVGVVMAATAAVALARGGMATSGTITVNRKPNLTHRTVMLLRCGRIQPIK